MFEDEVDVDDDKTIQISGDSSETLSEAGSRLQKKIQVKELE